MGDTAKPTAPQRRSADIQLASLEEVVQGLRDDILAVRHAAVDGLKQLDTRVHMLEDVRVRALEDWRLSQKVLDAERERTAHEQAALAEQKAASAEQAKRERRSRRQVWMVAGATVMATILGAMIATGQLF